MTGESKHIRWVVAALMLGILMASMDNTIVVTAMGTIVGELGGLDHFVWVVSAYMVAEMAGMLIFGKLSEMYRFGKHNRWLRLAGISEGAIAGCD